MDELPASASAAPASPGAALCRSCNLCCDGTLFAHGAARQDELAGMKAAGVPLDLAGERPQFRQPCIHHDGSGCAIYAARYQVCRSFRCALLRKVEAGAVGAEDAARLVAEARRLVAADPALATAATRKGLLLAGLPDRGASFEAKQAWLRAAAFDRFLDRHFRNRPALLWSDADSMSPDGPEARRDDEGRAP